MTRGGRRPGGFGAKRRWPLGLLALLAMIVSAAALYAVYSSRTLAPAVPGKAPVLSVAAIPAGFLVGTSKAVFSSRDAKSWVLEPSAGKGRTVVAGNGISAYALSGREVRVTQDLDIYRVAPRRISPAVAAAVSGQGELMIVGAGGLYLLETGGPRPIELPAQLKDPIAVAFGRQDGSPIIFAGGLTSGLWRQAGPAMKWLRVLKTPVRALGLDGDRHNKVLVGTSGGILISNNRGLSWSFTDMRVGVEAIAQRAGRWFAVSEDRLLFHSADGEKGWQSVLEDVTASG